MIITIQGRILECLPQTSGTSKNGKEWVSQNFIIGVNDDEECPICVQVFGEERLLSYDLRQGKRVAMILDIESKEWNGKWVNNISCKQCFVIPPRIEPSPKEKSITSNEFDYS